MFSFQYHITKLSDNTEEEMEQNDNRDIEQALQDLEGSLGTASVSNRVRTVNFYLHRSAVISPFYNKWCSELPCGRLAEKGYAEKKPASPLIVFMGRALYVIPPNLCGRQMMGASSLSVVVAG